MSISFAIQAPFVNEEEFARMTGQKESVVKQQVKDRQLPLVVLPQSSRQKDPSSTRRKRFINLAKLYELSSAASETVEILDFSS